MSTSSRNLADLQRSFAADGSFVVDPTTPYDPSVVLPLSQMSLEARPPSPSLSDPETKLRRYSRDLKEYHEALASMLNVDTKPSAVAQG